MERYEAKSLCQHSQTSIEHVQWVFENLTKLKICPISHNTLTLYHQHESSDGQVVKEVHVNLLYFTIITCNLPRQQWSHLQTPILFALVVSWEMDSKLISTLDLTEARWKPTVVTVHCGHRQQMFVNNWWM